MRATLGSLFFVGKTETLLCKTAFIFRTENDLFYFGDISAMTNRLTHSTFYLWVISKSTIALLHLIVFHVAAFEQSRLLSVRQDMSRVETTRTVCVAQLYWQPRIYSSSLHFSSYFYTLVLNHTQSVCHFCVTKSSAQKTRLVLWISCLNISFNLISSL